MNDTLLTIFLEDILPILIDAFFAFVLGVILKNVVPLLKTKFTANQLSVITKIITDLINSAERLALAGKLPDGQSKKEYVMDEAMNFIASKNYKFSEEQVDSIRRGLLKAIEDANLLVDTTVTELISGENETAPVVG